MNPIKSAILAMEQYHKDYMKGSNPDADSVSIAIAMLSESDRTFIELISNLENPASVYPVSDTLSDKFSLADLMMAYHYYLQEARNAGDKEALTIRVSEFYGLK